MLVYIKLQCLHASRWILRRGGKQVNKNMQWAVGFHYGHNGKVIFYFHCVPILRYNQNFLQFSHADRFNRRFTMLCLLEKTFIKVLNEAFWKNNDNVIGYWSRWGNVPVALPPSWQEAISCKQTPFVSRPGLACYLHTTGEQHSILAKMKNGIRQPMM